MERTTIEDRTALIPISEFGALQEDEEIWEGTDQGVRFKVTRHLLPVGEAKVEILSLSASGVTEERRQFIDEFSEVFGEPADTDLDDSRHYVDTVIWIISSEV